jgi:hypothetical protein
MARSDFAHTIKRAIDQAVRDAHAHGLDLLEHA